jgi:hypothetical protein
MGNDSDTLAADIAIGLAHVARAVQACEDIELLPALKIKSQRETIVGAVTQYHPPDLIAALAGRAPIALGKVSPLPIGRRKLHAVRILISSVLVLLRLGPLMLIHRVMRAFSCAPNHALQGFGPWTEGLLTTRAAQTREVSRPPWGCRMAATLRSQRGPVQPITSARRSAGGPQG